jgi:hypothetical protein
MGRPRGVIRRLADETGLDQATVRRALAAAGISEQACGDDFAKAVEIVRANADPARIAGHAANGRGEGGSSNATSTLAEARARAELMRAEKLEIENAKAKRLLISREDVTDTCAKILSNARTALLEMGHRLAPKVAGKTDLGEIARITKDEVRTVLGVIADDKAFFAAMEADTLS